MLFMVGAVVIDTFPFMVDGVEREAGADYASKAVMGGIKPREFGGEGDDVLTLKGKMSPFRASSDGTAELETLHGYRVAGERIYVMRGDGTSLGWREIDSIRETETEIQAGGLGFIKTYEIRMTKCDAAGSGGAGLVASILSLFG